MERLGTVLTFGQQALIESPAEYQRRLELRRRLQGADNVAEFIASQLDVLAAFIAAPNSPQFDQAVGAMLNLMDTVMGWRDRAYARRRATLPDMIARFLNLPPPPGAGKIPYDMVQEIVRAPRSVQVLEKILGKQSSEEQPAAWPEHEMFAALGRSQVVALLNDLQLAPDQLALLLPLVKQAQKVITTRDNETDRLLAKVQSDLAALRDSLLVAGTASDATLQRVVDLRSRLEDARLDAMAKVAEVIDQMQDILAPPQAVLIDWSKPAEVLVRQSPAVRAAVERRRAAVIVSILRFLDGLRNVVEPMFTQMLQGRCQDLAAQYFQPGSPAFAHAVEYLMRAARQMKMISIQDWPQASGDLAVTIAMDLGIMPAEGGPPGPPKRITWQSLYNMLTNPDTPELVQKMISARTPQQQG